MHIYKVTQPASSSPMLLLITCVTRRINRGSFHSTDQAKSPFPLSLYERLFIESAHLCSSNCWWCVHRVVEPKCLTSTAIIVLWRYAEGTLDLVIYTREANWVLPKCFRWIHWQKKCHYNKRARTCHPATSCEADQGATTPPARYVRDSIFKLSAIHASVTYQFSWIRWIQWSPLLFRENAIVSHNIVVKRLKRISIHWLKSILFWCLHKYNFYSSGKWRFHTYPTTFENVYYYYYYCQCKPIHGEYNVLHGKARKSKWDLNVCIWVCVKHQEWVLWQQVMVFTLNVWTLKNKPAKIKEKCKHPPSPVYSRNEYREVRSHVLKPWYQWVAGR